MTPRPKRRTGFQPMKSSEADLIYLVDQMVHDMGHRVALIRALADDLVRREGSRSPRLREATSQIAEAADYLARGLRMMRFFGSDEQPASCDFLVAILQPAMSWVSGYWGGSHLRADPTSRAAPHIQVRPGPARRGIVRLLGATRSRTISCDAETQTDSIVFHLTVHEPEFEPDAALLESVARSLHDAGAACKVERGPSDHTVRIALRLKRSAP